MRLSDVFSHLIAAVHSASRWFETLADRHQHGIAALGAISTTAAVIVALRSSLQARRASRPSLKARVTVMMVIYPGQKPSVVPTYVALRLTNVGNVPIRLHSGCFSWRIPLSKAAWMAQPMDEKGDDHVQAHRYPFALLPNTSDTLFLTQIERFERDGLPRILREGKLPTALAARWLRAYVYTDDGSLFRASLDSTIRKRIRAFAAAGASENE